MLQEIIASYKEHPSLPETDANSAISSVLEIMIELCPLQQFREACVSAQLPLFLYPILNSSGREDSSELIKTLSLTFIKTLLEIASQESSKAETSGEPQKESAQEAPKSTDTLYSVEFFKNTELVPLCLRNMELGSEQTKLAATQVFYTIISSKEGLEYTCQTYDRFMATSMILSSVLGQMAGRQSPELLETVIKIYTKLCGMANAKIVFSKNRPQMLYAEHIREAVRTSPKVKLAYEEFLRVLQS